MQKISSVQFEIAISNKLRAIHQQIELLINSLESGRNKNNILDSITKTIRKLKTVDKLIARQYLEQYLPEKYLKSRDQNSSNELKLLIQKHVHFE